MNFDLMNNIDFKRAIAPVSVADNTAQVSTVLDRIGSRAVCLAIVLGDISDADATFSVTFEHSDLSGSGFAAVAAADLIGTTALAAFTFANDNAIRKIGYKGPKRYLRATITPLNNASAALLSAVWVLGELIDAPAANPPV